MTERVRIQKVATRDGRPINLDDGHVVEGDELAAPTPGQPYAIRRDVYKRQVLTGSAADNLDPVARVVGEHHDRTALLGDHRSHRRGGEDIGRVTMLDDGAPDGIRPVSYTHLDVYKRQWM